MAGAIEQVLRCEVTLNPGTDSRERIMNVWHIGNTSTATVVEAAEDFRDDLSAFYQAIDASFADELDGQTPLLRVFDLSEPMPRQPIHEEGLATLACGNTSAARELAVVLSYRGVYVSGVTPKRRRGRIYLGPWASAIVDTATGLLNSTVVAGIRLAGENLLAASNASTDYTWVVYSPTTDIAGTGAPTAASVVVAGWVDNEVDVQRRRGRPQPGVKSPF